MAMSLIRRSRLRVGRPGLPGPGRRDIPDTARSALLGNLAALLTGIGAMIAFIGSSYYSTLFAHFDVEPSVLEIGQAERIAMGVVAVFALLVPVLQHLGAFLAILVAALAITFGIGGIAYLGDLRGWRWVVRLRRWHKGVDIAESTSLWLMRVAVICALTAIGLGAGRIAGDYDARAYHARIARGLGCDYRFAGGSLHGVLLGQDHARSLIITSNGVRIMKNETLEGVGPTATDCLDGPQAPTPGRPRSMATAATH